MITAEMLTQNESLSTLTDAQKTAIAELSANDEKSVLLKASKQYSDSISSVLKEKSGTERAKNESDADYISRVVSGYVESVNNLSASNKDLSDKLKSSANLPEEVEKKYTKQIADYKKLNETLTSTLANKEKEYSDALQASAKALNDVHLDYAFKEAFSGVKFKSVFTPELQAALLSSAKTEVLSTSTPDFVEENGVKSLVFRDADGMIKTNASNGLKPYTLTELLLQTSLKDAIETRVEKNGGGTKPINPNPGNGSFLVTATTQVEADNEISNYLLSQGKTKDSKEFQMEMARIRKENNVDKLKLR